MHSSSTLFIQKRTIATIYFAHDDRFDSDKPFSDKGINKITNYLRLNRE